MKLNFKDDKKISSALLSQRSHTINLNDCLHPQHYYVNLEIFDPDHKLVCEVAMSHDQYVQLMLSNGEVPVTLVRYRGLDGKLYKEEVDPPESVRDRYINSAKEEKESLKNRMADLRKDLYELLNSGKSVGKTKLSELLDQVKTLEQFFNANMEYILECGAEEISKIQDNARSQLSIFASQKFGVEKDSIDFTPLIEGNNQLLLTEKSQPVKDDYQVKERIQKPIDEMTLMELSDNIHNKLKRIEKYEDQYYTENNLNKERTQLYCPNVWVGKGCIEIKYINYQCSSSLSQEQAKKYLRFLNTINSVNDFSKFKSHHWFDKGETNDRI